MGNRIASGELSKALRPCFTNIKHIRLIQDDIIIAAIGAILAQDNSAKDTASVAIAASRATSKVEHQ